MTDGQTTRQARKYKENEAPIPPPPLISTSPQQQVPRATEPHPPARWIRLHPNLEEKTDTQKCPGE